MNTLNYRITILGRFLLATVAWLGMALSLRAAETNVFSTGFEAAEGYVRAQPLVGQQGWMGEGTGGNGVENEFIAGQGQQAYIGYWPPLNSDENQLYVWRPIQFRPLTVGYPVVRFSVLMNIVDSSLTNGQYDNFRWSVYNHQTNRLFALDFDNYYRDVSYALDGTNEFNVTEVTFTNDVSYLLSVTMDFTGNRWSASLSDRLIASNLPITTVNAVLTLGEIDAVWYIYDRAQPGDNYLLFDNYRIIAESTTVPRPRLQLLGRTGDGQVLLRLVGQSGTRFAIEATTSFSAWTSLKTNLITDGSFDFVDTSAGAFSSRFYRARQVP